MHEHAPNDTKFTLIFTPMAMATIRKVKRKFGDVYRSEVCVRGKRHSATFDRKSEEVLLADGFSLDGITESDLAFRDAIRLYEKNVLPGKPANSRARENVILDHQERAFGDPHLSEVTRERIAAYRDGRQVAASTIRQEFSILSSIFKRAAGEWGFMGSNPVPGVE